MKFVRFPAFRSEYVKGVPFESLPAGVAGRFLPGAVYEEVAAVVRPGLDQVCGVFEQVAEAGCCAVEMGDGPVAEMLLELLAAGDFHGQQVVGVAQFKLASVAWWLGSHGRYREC